MSAAEKAAKEFDSGALARRLAEVADSKGAAEIVVLDMRRLVSYTDYLAICTARNVPSCSRRRPKPPPSR